MLDLWEPRVHITCAPSRVHRCRDDEEGEEIDRLDGRAMYMREYRATHQAELAAAQKVRRDRAKRKGAA